ncbi:hypothetical protein Tco_1407044 [Tanacetum coccineum]
MASNERNRNAAGTGYPSTNVWFENDYEYEREECRIHMYSSRAKPNGKLIWKIHPGCNLHLTPMSRDPPPSKSYWDRERALTNGSRGKREKGLITKSYIPHAKKTLKDTEAFYKYSLDSHWPIFHQPTTIAQTSPHSRTQLAVHGWSHVTVHNSEESLSNVCTCTLNQPLALTTDKQFLQANQMSASDSGTWMKAPHAAVEAFRHNANLSSTMQTTVKSMGRRVHQEEAFRLLMLSMEIDDTTSLLTCRPTRRTNAKVRARRKDA